MKRSQMRSIHATSARFLAAATVAASIAIGSAAVATAAPVWDIEHYDKCIKNGGHPHDCCINSDGIWNGEKCVAPLANQQGGQQPGTSGPGLEQPPVTTLPPRGVVPVRPGEAAG
jgi:hypothetical protein